MKGKEKKKKKKLIECGRPDHVFVLLIVLRFQIEETMVRGRLKRPTDIEEIRCVTRKKLIDPLGRGLSCMWFVCRTIDVQRRGGLDVADTFWRLQSYGLAFHTTTLFDLAARHCDLFSFVQIQPSPSVHTHTHPPSFFYFLSAFYSSRCFMAISELIL